MRRTFIAILIIALMCVPLHAAGTVPPEFVVDQDVPKYSENRDIRDEMHEFLMQNGYIEGQNTRTGEGSFFISTGTGEIQAQRNSSAYISSRSNAFDKAMLAAKKSMVEYIGIEIRRELLSEYTEGQDPANRKEKDAEAIKGPGMYDKATALINAQLNKMLEKEGVDLNKSVPQAVAQKIVNSEVFEKFTSTAARARVVGFQAMKVFEVSPDGKQGQIGVVAVYSDKLHSMANALSGGSASQLPQGTPKRPIVEQLPRDNRVLLSTFGVQQKTDENGKLVLVAFGQSSPINDNPRALEAAYDKAKIEALGALRSFAGEIAAVHSDMAEYESFQELEDGMKQYESESYYKQKIQTSADGLKISGIAPIKRWDTIHPLTNRKVVGAVISWSPDSAARASRMGQKMALEPNKKPASAVEAGPKAQNGSAKTTQSGSFRGSGAAADRDSF
jgi:hypothetical protein